MKTHSSTKTCTGRHPMADSSLTGPARTTHPGPLWTKHSRADLTQRKQRTRRAWYVSNLRRACSPLTESVCVRSNTSGRQTGCTSAHQRCGGSNTEKERRACYAEVTQIIRVISIQKLPDRNRERRPQTFLDCLKSCGAAFLEVPYTVWAA